jgi:hypothetical protein
MKNTKRQTPNTEEASSVRGARDISVAFGIWDFAGVWCLVFGVSEAELPE